MPTHKLRIAGPICLIYGTRPEVIKLAPVLHELQARNMPFVTINTGQHFSKQMMSVFLNELNLPQEDYHLEMGREAKKTAELDDIENIEAEQLSLMISAISKIIQLRRPSIVLVHGDTNTALAGALASIKNRFLIGHVEAGLRSFNKRMSEEVNRVLIDHVSDILFAPTILARDNLLSEGIRDKIILTGNTIVDSVLGVVNNTKRMRILQKFSVEEKQYGIVTIHRQENVDQKDRLSAIVDALSSINFPLIFPVHPRTLTRLREFSLEQKLVSSRVKCAPPLSYGDFLNALKSSKLVITDSGGIQEEAYILKVPCLTIREDTERQETLHGNANILIGKDFELLEKKVKSIIFSDNHELLIGQSSPFGLGGASKAIVEFLETFTRETHERQINMVEQKINDDSLRAK